MNLRQLANDISTLNQLQASFQRVLKTPDVANLPGAVLMSRDAVESNSDLLGDIADRLTELLPETPIKIEEGEGS